MGANAFSGGIPTSFGNLAALTRLDLDNDQLTDTIPASLGNLTQITNLYLNNNQLTGSIPSSLGNMVQAKIFDLHGNLLSGSIPSSLGNLTQASFLQLNNNQLTGSIPGSLGNLGNIFNLLLQNNRLSGAVPASLGHISAFGAVSIINNRFTFDSLEQVLALHPSGIIANPQAVIPLHLSGNLFSVYTGGTLANDTFHWYKDNVLYQTITGDSTLTVTVTGNYSVQVTNKIITPATGLILFSDTLNSNGTTPITFVSFTGKAVNNTSLLQWQSTNEVNTSYFMIQRVRRWNPFY